MTIGMSRALLGGALGVVLFGACCCGPAGPATTVTASWRVNCPAGCAAVNTTYSFDGALATTGAFAYYGDCSLRTSGANRILDLTMVNEHTAGTPDHGIDIVGASFGPTAGAPATAWTLRAYYNRNEWIDSGTTRNCVLTLTGVDGTTVNGTFVCSGLQGVAGQPNINICGFDDRGCLATTPPSTGVFVVRGCSVQ